MDETNLPGGAFIIGEGGGLAKVSRQSFSSEDEFQELIALYPDVLAGELLTPDAPRQWLLVDREAGIADSEDGGDRWAVDHIFLDQDATPTFVEVKRRSDSGLKRNVVGQILGYVAFATAYLAGERLRELFRDRVAREGGDPEQALAEFIPDGADPEEFWGNVDRKMRSGEVRALVVADAIPNELRRVLEFLNRHMDSVHVAGIELQLYATAGYRTLVPRVVGQTAESEDRRTRLPARDWTLDEVRELIRGSNTPELLQALDRLLVWAENDWRVEIALGRGAKLASLHFRVRTEGGLFSVLQLYIDPTNGMSALAPFASLKQVKPYTDSDMRNELVVDISERIDRKINTENTERYPLFSLRNDTEGAKTCEVFSRVIDRIHAASQKE